MRRGTVLILLLSSLCFLGGSYYRVADDDILYSQALQYKENRNIFRVLGVASNDTLLEKEKLSVVEIRASVWTC